MGADNYKWRAFTANAVAVVTTVASMSMVFVSLSAIAEEFDVTLRTVSWVVIAQALVITALMIPMGRLADLTGRRRVHLIGLVLFGTGSLLAALAPSLPLLVAAQVISAIGNAMVQSVAAAIVVSVFPPAERGTAIGAQVTAVAIGAAAGPIIAGLLLEITSWRALFGILVIPTILAHLAGTRLLREEPPALSADQAGFDTRGAMLSGVSVTALVLTINNPFGLSWDSGWILLGLAFGIGGVIAFLRWESRAPSPMLDLSLFSNRLLRLSLLTRLFGFMSNTITRLLLPIFLISFRELSEGTAGLLLFANAVGLGVASNAGRLADRFGERRFTVAGLLGLLATTLMLMSVDGTTALWIVTVVALANGVAQGAWSVPNNSLVMGSVPSSSLGLAGAMTSMTRNVANVLGQAAASAVVTAVMIAQGFDIALDDIPDTAGAGAAFLDGWQFAYVLSATFALIAVVLSWFCRIDRGPAHDSEAGSGLRTGREAPPRSSTG